MSGWAGVCLKVVCVGVFVFLLPQHLTHQTRRQTQEPSRHVSSLLTPTSAFLYHEPTAKQLEYPDAPATDYNTRSVPAEFAAITKKTVEPTVRVSWCV